MMQWAQPYTFTAMTLLCGHATVNVNIYMMSLTYKIPLFDSSQNLDPK